MVMKVPSRSWWRVIDLGDENGLDIDVGNGDEGTNEVMMGAENLGDEDGLDIDVRNNCVGVVGKSANPPRNWTGDSNSMSELVWTVSDSWIRISWNDDFSSLGVI